MRPFGLALILALAITSSSHGAFGQAPAVQARPEVFTWKMVGESPHWVVILHGYGQKVQGRVSYANARPWVIWAGGDEIPSQYTLDFTVDQIHCIHGTLGFDGSGSKFSLVAPCKLVYPRSPSVSGDRPQDFIDAIRKSGQFTLKWNHRQETITWGRAFPEGIHPHQ